jgi:MFS transporter, FSR family, fosmidomycin resistance protein
LYLKNTTKRNMYRYMHVLKPNVIANIVVYGAAHAMVDASCAVIIFANYRNSHLELTYFAFLAILYNFLAFALQTPLGFMADKLRIPTKVAIIGCLLTALSIGTFRFTLPAICLAGIGNALFHIGGGIVSLNLSPGKASIPGIFVAPGALGLLIGTLIGKSGHFVAWPFIVLLIMFALILARIKHPVINYDTRIRKSNNYFELIIFLLLISIVVRSMIGLALDFPWKSNIYLLIGLTLAVVLGKAFGGILADKYGWVRVTVPGLILSAAFISFGLDYPYISIPGVFLFNITMPVTLVAVSNMLPGRPGFAFGLTTLALFAGALPTFTGIKAVLYNKWIIFTIILVSAFILYRGLRLYFSDKTYFTKNTTISLKD